MREAGAALVAAQLLAFYREPVRYRPRLTHGREPFGGGLLVFRFAQGRFPQALLRELSAAKREALRQAALFFIRQVCLWEGASYYQVLCVPPEARRETIKEHYHGLMALIHPDRQEAGAPHWPAEFAQRVNRAYEVLSDDGRRRAYDAGLHKAAAGSATLEEGPFETPLAPRSPGAFRGARGSARARMRKPVLLIALAVSLLFFAQIWWAGEVPGEYAAIPGTAPFELSLRWMREAYSTPEADTPGRRKAGEGVPVAASTAVPVVHAAAERGTVMAIAAPPEREAPARTPEERPASSPSPPLQESAAPIVQASANLQAAQGTLTATDMEGMVARVVTYYEAGDVDKLLGLYDASRVGLWEALRLRHDFEEFFRATRTRRLRLKGVSWDTSAPTARVTGAAKLAAEYHDGTVPLERQIGFEMEIVSRDGQPRIARLSLFPHER